MLVVGLAVGAFGVVRMLGSRRLRRTGVAAVGTVVRHEETSDDGPIYQPVVAFVDEGGGEHQFTAAMRTSWRVHRVGQRVPVRYPAGRPGAAELVSGTHAAVVAGLPLAFGVVFALLGLFWSLQG